MRKSRILFSLLLAPLALTACANDKKPPRMCPQVAYIRELNRVEDYGNDRIDPGTLVSVAKMANVEGACAYADKGVDVTFDLALKAQKGPRLGGDKFSTPYFVSLVSPEEKVIGKELLTASFDFPSDKTMAEKTESLHVFIPLAKDEDASNYRVLMGFQLTEEQVKAIRAKEDKGE